MELHVILNTCSEYSEYRVSLDFNAASTILKTLVIILITDLLFLVE